jgi:hypothetical protein
MVAPCREEIVKKALFLFLPHLLFLQGCLFEEEKEELPPTRQVYWGLQLEIGKYKTDSIYGDTTVDYGHADLLYIDINNVCDIEPGCDTVARKGRILDWDPSCFSAVRFASLDVGGYEAIHEISENGEFNWSDNSLFPVSNPLGIAYVIYPISYPDSNCYRHIHLPAIQANIRLRDYGRTMP